MNVGLCSGRHVVKTNEGVVMNHYLFDSPVTDPTATDVHEKMCRDFLKKFMENMSHGMDSRCGGVLRWNRFNLYVTGLTPLLTSFLKCWVEQQERLEMGYADLVLWHWDTETEQYVPQKWAVVT